MLRPLVPACLLLASVSPHCWKPNINPFTGPPDTERLEGDTGEWDRVGDVVFTLSATSSVRVTWESVFPPGRDCAEVEFLIKSHPLDSPSNYKLSDLTLKGKRTAVLAVPPGEDFIFQVRLYKASNIFSLQLNIFLPR